MKLRETGIIFGISIFIFISTTLVRADLEYDYMRDEIIPDVLDKAPRNLLKIFYNGVDVPYGGEVTPTAAKDYPEIKWNFNASAIYTLVMIDPDAPSRKEPKMREALHWMMYNIPGNDFTRGQVLAEYMGAGPPRDSGLHRYILSVHKQKERLMFEMEPINARQLDGRTNFSLRNFIKNHKLVAQPTAGTMFLAQYDDYVPTFYKNLGMMM